MGPKEDFRDWPHVTLADARDAAADLGWLDELDRLATEDAAPGGIFQGDFRAAFVFRLVNGIGDAVRAGKPLDSFPKEAIHVFNAAGRGPNPDPSE